MGNKNVKQTNPKKNLISKDQDNYYDLKAKKRNNAQLKWKTQDSPVPLTNVQVFANVNILFCFE